MLKESMKMEHWIFEMKLIFGIFEMHEWSKRLGRGYDTKYQRTADVSYLFWRSFACGC